MKSLSVKAEPEYLSAPGADAKPRYPSLLDIESTSARKRFKRMYHRVRSGLERDGNVRLLTLTSSPGANSPGGDLPGAGDFQRDFRKLIMRLRRRGLVTDYIRCPELTRTGLRHDHILFRGSYIEQAYLSYLWGELHHSPVVDIRRVKGRHWLSCYLANDMAKAPAGRYSYSWGWVWKGFAKSWQRLKRYSREMNWNYARLLTFWRICVKLDIKIEGMIPI